MALTDDACCFNIRRKMNMLARLARQAFRQDRGKEAVGSAMVKPVGWITRIKAQIDRDTMALIRPNARSVCAESETLFVRCRDDLFNVCMCQRHWSP